jgi:hypothetical protein
MGKDAEKVGLRVAGYSNKDNIPPEVEAGICADAMHV